MKYSYVNGVMNVTTYVRDGWRRFHSMNAQYQLLKKETDSTTFEYFNFISYDTPIARISHITKKDDTINSWRLDITEYWNCSPSTKRQLSRFLREFDLPYTLNDIDMYFNHNEQYKEDCYNGMVHSIHCISTNKLDGFFRTNASQHNSFPCEILTK